MSKSCVVLGLGSNINAIQNLRLSLVEIKKLSQVVVTNVASIYESDALLPENAPQDWNKKYLNSAVEVEVENFEPLDFLKRLKSIEQKMGRKDSDRWAPRLIDIDILWAENFELKSETLKIPHDQIYNRPFALLPLLELRPDFPIAQEPHWLTQKEKPFATEISKKYVWPKFAGILNLTTDSFSQDGALADPLKKIGSLLDQGADIIDIGAESTRPNATEIDPESEFQRLKHVLELVEKFKKDYDRDFEISVDCRKPEVMQRVINHFKIDYLNDVEGFRKPQMRELLKYTEAKAVCMHSFSVPPLKAETIPDHEDVWRYLSQWWLTLKNTFVSENLNPDRMIFDPGIGFGKTPQQCVDILNYLEGFSEIKEEIYLGYSRKSFLSLMTDKPAAERDPETALVTESLNQAYAQYIRVHNVADNMHALTHRTLL